jgi:hypothetical protein
MRHLAPSIFATGPVAAASEKYSFLPTIQIVTALEGEGWYPVLAREAYVRGAHRGFQKHMVRMRHRGLEDSGVARQLGDTHLEAVLTNSHDLGAAFMLGIGVWELACLNGMMVASMEFASFRLRHIGLKMEDVIDASYRVIESAPLVAGRVKEFQAISLTEADANYYAARAAQLTWANPKPVRAASLLQARRTSDQATSLWKTYNRVQENIIRGGVTGGGRKTVPIRSITRDVEINRGLWQLTEQVAAIKSLPRPRQEWPQLLLEAPRGS